MIEFWCLASLLAISLRAKFRRKKIYLFKFFHNCHLSESSFTCPGLQASGLAQRLLGIQSRVEHGRTRVKYVEFPKWVIDIHISYFDWITAVYSLQEHQYFFFWISVQMAALWFLGRIDIIQTITDHCVHYCKLCLVVVTISVFWLTKKNTCAIFVEEYSCKVQCIKKRRFKQVSPMVLH